MKPDKKKRSKTKNKEKKLTNDLLDKIEKCIFVENKVNLKRSGSMDFIEFPRRLVKPGEEALRAWRRDRKRAPSAANMVKFEEYKILKGYECSKWSENIDPYFDNNREWVRDIWNVWFDEVIPKLNEYGELIRDTSQMSNYDKPRSAVESRGQNNTNSSDETDQDARKSTKSPTPYDMYSQIDLASDEQPIDLATVKLLEKEIEKLTNRIHEKISAYDLARRGTLYRKVLISNIIPRLTSIHLLHLIVTNLYHENVF